jgi:hypothetical protein
MTLTQIGHAAFYRSEQVADAINRMVLRLHGEELFKGHTGDFRAFALQSLSGAVQLFG